MTKDKFSHPLDNQGIFFSSLIYSNGENKFAMEEKGLYGELRIWLSSKWREEILIHNVDKSDHIDIMCHLQHVKLVVTQIVW